MAGELIVALGGELTCHSATGRRLVEVSLPLSMPPSLPPGLPQSLQQSRQSDPSRQSALAGVETLAIGFEEGGLMTVCTMLDRWSGVTRPLPDVATAIAFLSDPARANLPIHLILLHADALQEGSDGAPDFANRVADATFALRRHCTPHAAIALCVQHGMRSSVAGLLDAAPELLSVLECPIQSDRLFHVATAARAICGMPTAVSRTIIGARNAPADSLARPSALAAYRVLLAENNATNAIVMRKILERAGHYSELVKNGELALDRLTSDRFDAAVLDANMPIMSGCELAKAYRYMTQAEDRVPIILFSAEPEAGVVGRCDSGDIAAFLSARFSAPDLLGALNRVVTGMSPAAPGVTPPESQTSQIGANGPGLPEPDSQQLDHEVLAELEEISPDPAFLDKLLNGFVQDNRVLLDRLRHAVHTQRNEEARQLLHAIKGSAVSVGALALKDLCCQLEKIAAQELCRDSARIIVLLDSGFHRFCEALSAWREQRRQRLSR